MRLASSALLVDGQTISLVTRGQGERITRMRTELQVPTPSRRDALGQHITARVLARTGFSHLPSYHPDRRRTT